jgi:biopolymer transport protein ExbD
MLNNRKGQVGESITWVIATIVVIVLLIIFVYASIVLSEFKSLKVNSKKISTGSVDWIDSKTQMAYSISPSNKNKIQVWISQETVNE